MISIHNVPGAFSSNKGEDFRAVLEAVCSVKGEGISVPEPPKGKWSSAGSIVADGFSLAWRVLDAQFWGVPQRRKRIYLVADFAGLCAPEVLFERKGLSGDFEPGQAAGEEAAGGAGGSACAAISFRERGGKGSLTQEERSGAISTKNNQYVLCLNDQGGSSISTTKDYCGTLRANAHGNEPIVARIMGFGSYIDDGTASTVKSRDYKGSGDLVVTAADCHSMYVRRYTPLEEERLQEYPDGWTDMLPRDRIPVSQMRELPGFQAAQKAVLDSLLADARVRDLLDASDIGRIKRPYQLVMGRNDPAVMYAPDISQTPFNDLLGMGNPEHNCKLLLERCARRRVREPEVSWWNVWEPYIRKLQAK